MTDVTRRCMQVIENEGLQRNCTEVGDYLLTRMRALQSKYDVIGDVRGAGLMLGLELVRDRGSKVRGSTLGREGAVLELVCWQALSTLSAAGHSEACVTADK